MSRHFASDKNGLCSVRSVLQVRRRSDHMCRVEMSRGAVVILLTALASYLNIGDAARILGIFPTASFSHQVVFRGLTTALNKRGHEIVVVTTDPLNDASLKNYTEIDVHFIYDSVPHGMNLVAMRKQLTMINSLPLINDLISRQTHAILNFPEFKKIYDVNSGEHFDLVIIETLFGQAYLPIVKRFDAPWIGISSLGLNLNTHYAVGNPILPSHESTWEMVDEVSKPKTFWKRLTDFYLIWRYIYQYRTEYMDHQEEIARKYFGDYGSTLHEIENNMSLVFVNQQLPISFPRPTVPKVIEIGGFHLAKQPKPISKELKKILDDAKNGFIYMSLGSNAKSNMLSNKTREAFVAAFSKLPYTVLWKFEDDTLPGKPDNVYTMKWIPQQAVLAHPNIKVFVYQGGLQSTEEAISHGVPLVGFPVMADQDGQIMKMVSIGVCKQLEITDFTADELIEAITTVATDHSYKQRMLNLRSIIDDKVQDPFERAVWWTEHVIRHGGTPYLHSATADLPWYQREDMDIIAFITTTFLLGFILSLGIIFKVLGIVRTVLSATKKEKSN